MHNDTVAFSQPYTLQLLRFLVEFTEHIGLSEDSLLCIVVCFAVSSSMSLSRKFRRLICVPVDFIKITLAFMAVMSRMFPTDGAVAVFEKQI